MDKGSYTYQALSAKYEEFRAPDVQVSVDGTNLNSLSTPILELEVNLSIGAASSCRFVIGDVYDAEQSKWRNDLDKKIKVGSTLVIQGGYIKKEEIFYGYVDELSIEQGGEEFPRIVVNGLDGLGYLMSCRQPIYAGQKQPQKVVEEIFDKAISAGYARSKTVGNLSGFTVPIIKEKLDDFRYLSLLAERYCMSLLSVDGELIFDNVTRNSTSLVTLSANTNLIQFSKRLSLRGQVGQVEIWGRDVNQKFIKGSATSVSVGGSGKTAVQVATAFKDAAIREYCEYVRTEEECNKLAQARLDSAAMGFVSGEGMCVGIPELIAGRFITIKGVSESMEGDYFLQKVCHRFTGEGYYTTFEVKGARG